MASTYPLLTDPSLFQARKRRLAQLEAEPPPDEPLYSYQGATPRIEPQNAPLSNVIQSPDRPRLAGPEAIQAETAPLEAPMRPRSLPAEVMAEGVRSDNPMVRRQAVDDQVVSAFGEPIAETMRRGPRALALEAEQGRDPSPARHGFGQKLLHVLSTAGKGALMGAAHGGLGGAIAGAGIGAASPGTVDRAVQRQYTLPRLEAEAQAEEQGQQRRFSQLSNAANLAGEIPGMGPTEVTRHRYASEAETASRNRAMDENQDAARAQRGKIAGDALDWRKQYGTARLAQHQQGLDNGSHQLVKGMAGNGKVGWFSVNKADASDVVQVADADGKPLETPDAMIEGGKNARFAAGQAGADRRAGAGIASREHEGAANRQAAGERQQTDISAGKYQKSGKGKGLRGYGLEGQGNAPAGKTKTYSTATLEKFAKSRNVDMEAAKRILEQENPGVRFEFK